ncbi:MAG: TRZ/ATZ family hydrolase [Pseudomonadota bacterium]|nr:TRZ/ATZ family hydrolase [Pseudomonadota bacterium]
MSKKKALHAGWIVPVKPANMVLENHSLIIDGQKISAILPTEKWLEKKKKDNVEEIDYRSSVLIPGLINCHNHSPMSLLRGYAEDLSLKEWLRKHIWPIESAFVNKEFVRDGSTLSIAEMLLSGTTCFNDMYFYGDETARSCIESGIRACIGMIIIMFPSAWAGSVDEYFKKGQKIHDDFRTHPLISCAFAPHAPYTIDDDSMLRVATLAEEMDVQIHMHVQETREEVEESVLKYGCSPIRRLKEHGLLSPRLTAVHATSISDEDISFLARSGVNVAHCPRSNLKLGSGIAPILRMSQAGLNVAIGTDSAASNNDLDMLGEMRTASLLAKGINKSPTALPANVALEMATYNGAQALGLGEKIGSLETGKLADIVAIEINQIGSTPVYDPVVQIVYNGHKNQIRAVWVGGRQLVNDGQLLTIDTRQVVEKTKFWQEKIAAFKNNTS